MTAPLRVTWAPGQALPRRANRITLQAIIEHELGATVGPRFLDRLDVTPIQVAGQNVWPVDATLKAAKLGRMRRRPPKHAQVCSRSPTRAEGQ